MLGHRTTGPELPFKMLNIPAAGWILRVGWKKGASCWVCFFTCAYYSGASGEGINSSHHILHVTTDVVTWTRPWVIYGEYGWWLALESISLQPLLSSAEWLAPMGSLHCRQPCIWGDGMPFHYTVPPLLTFSVCRKSQYTPGVTLNV